MVLVAARVAAALLALACVAADAQVVSGSGVGGSGYYAAYAGFPNASTTGDVSEHSLAQVRIPANTLGPNGTLRVTLNYSYPNNANNKSILVRLGGNGIITGANTVAFSTLQSTSVNFQNTIIISNAGVTNSQQTFPGPTGAGTMGTANNVTSADTTADFFVNLNAQLAVGTDTITLVKYLVEAMHP